MSKVLDLHAAVDLSKLVPHTPEWNDWRRGGIGGSDAAVITGDDPYRRPLTLWLDKSGYLERDDDDDDDAPRWWGRKLEQSVIERFELDTGLAVIQRQLCIEHHLDRWRRATLDGLVCERIEKTAFAEELPAYLPGSELGLYEGKMTSKIGEWADGPPIHVQIQVQHNLDVADVDTCWLGVLFTAPIVHFKHYVIDRDESITGPLREMERLFWQRVLDHNAPSAESMDLDALKRAYRDQVVADAIEFDAYNEQHKLEEPIEAIIADLVAARAAKSSAEHREETAQAMLAALLQEHETGTIGGVPVVHWRRHEKQFIDLDALRAAHPKLVEQFTTRRPYRQFTIPKERGNVNESR